MRGSFSSPVIEPAAGAPRGSRARLAELPSWLLPAGALVLLALVLLPVLHAPFFSDDITNSELHGYLVATDKSLPTVMRETTWHSLHRSGRPQVLTAVGIPLFDALGNHPVLYHAYLLLMTLLDAALLYLLLRRLGVGRASAALPLALAAGLIQLRIYHDSLISFVALIQWLFAYTLGSALLFERWLRLGRRRDLWLAVGLFALCVMIYEVAYAFAAVHVALAFTRRRGRAAVRAALPFVALAAAFVVASWVLRRVAPPEAVDYKVAGGPWTTVRTYFVQLFPPLPATSIMFDPSLGGGATPAELLAAVWRGLAVAGAAAGLSVVAMRERVTAAATGAAVALGLALWLAPPLFLSVTPKYQRELGPGTGYLPVLMQVFGVAILLACGVRVLLSKAQARSRAATVAAIALIACGAGLVAGVTAFNNMRVVAMMQPEHDIRALLESGTARGAFDQAPEHASVFFSDVDVGWSTATPLLGLPWVQLMLADRTGHRYDARVDTSGAPEEAPCARTGEITQRPCALPAASAFWARARLRADGGTVIVAREAPSARRRTARVAGELRVYREADDGGEPSAPRLRGEVAPGVAWTSARVTWRLVAHGDGWGMYLGRLGPGRPPIASSLDDQRPLPDFAQLTPAKRVRLLGTKRLLP
jgi:hypothetical protein